MKAIFFVKTIFTHRYLTFILRLYIGGLFIYASIYKIKYPELFAYTIATYNMVPYWAIDTLAFVLPWVEFISGVLLFAGIRARFAAVIICLLLIIFTIATFTNLMRGACISCGCFNDVGEVVGFRTVVRDIIWIIMTIHIIFFDKVFHLEKGFSLIFKKILGEKTEYQSLL